LTRPPFTLDDPSFYAEHFDAVEVDSTFYACPSVNTGHGPLTVASFVELWDGRVGVCLPVFHQEISGGFYRIQENTLAEGDPTSWRNRSLLKWHG
jgi:hypothetical protein